MFWNFLTEGGNTAAGNGGTQIFTWILLGVVIVAFVAYFLIGGRKNKARQKEYEEQLSAIRPGHKVKTAGGICGIIVEVCDDDNTVIIETGSEQSGKSYIKLDKELIAQTDAKGPTQIAREEAEAAKKAEKEAKQNTKTVYEVQKEEPAETPAETPAEVPVETPVADSEDEKTDK